EYHVCISHAPADDAFADSLTKALVTAGFRSASASDSFDSALGKSKAAIVLISRAWLNSDWHRKEASVLLSRRGTDPEFRLIPVIVEGVELPEPWHDVGGIDLRNTSLGEPQIHRLIYAVAGQKPPVGL